MRKVGHKVNLKWVGDKREIKALILGTLLIIGFSCFPLINIPFLLISTIVILQLAPTFIPIFIYALAVITVAAARIPNHYLNSNSYIKLHFYDRIRIPLRMVQCYCLLPILLQFPICIASQCIHFPQIIFFPLTPLRPIFQVI